MPEELKLALKCRLEFREAFLRTVEEADSRSSMENIKKHWNELGSLLPALKSSEHLGKGVLASFSEKLQRKLASTVPPRPIVDLEWEAAFDHLERLCQDGSVAAEVLEYYDSHSLMVSGPLITVPARFNSLDICHFLSIPKASAFGIHSHVTSTLYLRRHDNIGHHVHSTNS